MLQQSLSKLLWGGWRPIDRSAVNVHAMRVWACLIWRTIGLLKDWLTWVNPCQRTWCWDERQAIPFLTSSQTPKQMFDASLRPKHWLSMNAIILFATFLCHVLSWNQKELYQELVVGSASHGLAQLVDGGGSLALELGARFGLFEQFACLVACTECITPSWVELQSGPGRHAQLSSLWQWLGRNDWERLLLLWVSLSTLESPEGMDSLHQT